MAAVCIRPKFERLAKYRQFPVNKLIMMKQSPQPMCEQRIQNHTACGDQPRMMVLETSETRNVPETFKGTISYGDGVAVAVPFHPQRLKGGAWV